MIIVKFPKLGPPVALPRILQGTYLQKYSILPKVGTLQKNHNILIFCKVPDLLNFI